MNDSKRDIIEVDRELFDLMSAICRTVENMCILNDALNKADNEPAKTYFTEMLALNITVMRNYSNMRQSLLEELK